MLNTALKLSLPLYRASRTIAGSVKWFNKDLPQALVVKFCAADMDAMGPWCPTNGARSATSGCYRLAVRPCPLARAAVSK